MVLEIIMLAMGLYVLISGIKGNGRLYTTQHIKEGMEEKSMKGQKLIYILLGIAMTINSLATMAQMYFFTGEMAGDTYVYTATDKLPASLGWLTGNMLNTVSFIFMALSMVLIVILFVFLRKVMVKPEKKKKEQNPKAAPGTLLPSDAFDFDDAIEGDHWVNPNKLAKEAKQAKKAAKAAAAKPAETAAKAEEAVTEAVENAAEAVEAAAETAETAAEAVETVVEEAKAE